MSRGKRQRWYKKDVYNEPREPFDPGDGSLVEVMADPDPKHPTALKITRVWPDDLVTTVRKVPPTQFSDALYLEVVGDREIPTPIKHKDGTLDERLGSGTYRPPYTITNAVPGQKPGENFHAGTGRNFDSREEFNQYFKENNLELVGPNEASRMHLKQSASDEAGERPTTFEHKNGIPVPPQFQGKKFHYAAKE